MNKIIKQENDVSIFEDGSVYISQRKLAVELGVNQSSIQRLCASRNINVKQGLSVDSTELCITHYAFDARKTTDKARNLAKKIMKAGTKAYLYHLAKYELNATPKAVPMSPQEIADQALQLLTESNNANKRLQAEKDVLQSQLASIGNHLAGSTIGELGEDLMMNVAAKLLSTNLGIDLGQNAFMQILRSKGWLMVGRSVYERNMPTQSRIKFMRVYLHQDHYTGKMKATTVIRPEGMVKLSTKIIPWYLEYLNIKQAEKGLAPFPPNYFGKKRK